MSGSPAGETGPDYAQFARSLVQLRLQELRRTAATLDEEPPCLPAAPATDSLQQRVAADTARPGEDNRYFRLSGRVQPRRDTNGRVIEIMFVYDVALVTNCAPEMLLRDTRAFAERDALDEIQGAADEITAAIRARAINQVRIGLDTPVFAGDRLERNTGSELRNALAFAMSQAKDFGFVAVAPGELELKYRVRTSVAIRRERGQRHATLKFEIRDNSEHLYPLPDETVAFSAVDQLTSAYFDASRAVVSALQRLESDEQTRLTIDPSQLSTSVIVGRARALLCSEGSAGDRSCSENPHAAISVLDRLSSAIQQEPEALELRADAHMLTHDSRTAAGEFEASLARLDTTKYTDRIRVLRKAAEARFETADYPSAAQHLQRAIEISRAHASDLPLRWGPRTVELVALARTWRQLKEHGKAYEALSAALALGDPDEDINSEFESLLGELPAAQLEEHLSKLADNPRVDQRVLAGAWTRVGEHHSGNKNWTAAASAHQKAYHALSAQRQPDQQDLAMEANKAGLALDSAGQKATALEWHEVALRHGRDAWPAASTSIHRLAGNLAHSLIVADRAAEAEALMKALVEAGPTLVETNDFLQSLLTLARALGQQRKHADALSVRRRVADMQGKAYGRDSREYTLALLEMGSTYEQAGRYEDAATIESEALAIREKLLGKNHIDLAPPINNIGLTYYYRGNYRKAADHFGRALALTKDSKDHVTVTLTEMHNLALVALLAGNAAEAERLRREVIELGTIPRDASTVATSYSGLGDALRELGRLAEATKSYEQALEMFSGLDANERWRQSYALAGLGTVQTARGQFELAANNLDRALELVTSARGKDSLLYATRLVEVAELRYEQGKLEDARGKFEEAREIQRRVGGLTHPAAALTTAWLGDIAFKQHQFERALELHQESQTGLVLSLTADHPAVARCQIRMAWVLEAQGNYDAAEAMARKAWSQAQSRYSARHPLAADAEHILGKVLAHRKDGHIEAVRHLETAASIYSEVFGSDASRTAAVHTDLDSIRR